MTIVLTGTTGNLGSATLHHLLTLLPPSEIIVSVFNPNDEARGALKKLGVEVRSGDYTKPETLEEAYKGATKLFLVSSPNFDADLRIQSHANAINAAIKAGVKHIVYTSFAVSLSSDQESASEVEQVHLKTERVLKSSGTTYTIIREGVYIESYSIILGFFKITDEEVVLPGDGKVPWVVRDDLAAANARILASNEPKALDPQLIKSNEFVNQTVLLSGPKAYTLEETIKLISDFLKREIKFKKVTKEEWVQRLGGGAGPEIVAKFYTGIEQGELAVESNRIQEINGKPMRPVADRLKELVIAADAETRKENESWVQHGC